MRHGGRLFPCVIRGINSDGVCYSVELVARLEALDIVRDQIKEIGLILMINFEDLTQSDTQM